MNSTLSAITQKLLAVVTWNIGFLNHWIPLDELHKYDGETFYVWCTVLKIIALLCFFLDVSGRASEFCTLLSLWQCDNSKNIIRNHKFLIQLHTSWKMQMRPNFGSLTGTVLPIEVSGRIIFPLLEGHWLKVFENVGSNPPVKFLLIVHIYWCYRPRVATSGTDALVLFSHGPVSI